MLASRSEGATKGYWGFADETQGRDLVREYETTRDGEQIARNVQPVEVEPGKFAYRLVRGELEYATAGTVEAHCRVDQGPVTVVPYTLMEPTG